MGLSKKKNKEKFNPLSPSYDTEGDFNDALRKRTQGQYRPQLITLKKGDNRNRRESRGRQKQIKRDYNWLAQQEENTANQVANSVSSTLEARNSADDTAQQNLLAALAASQGAEANMAALRGSASAPDTARQFGAVISDSAGGGSRGDALGGALGALAIDARRDVSTAKLGKTRAKAEERERLRSSRQEFKDDRLELLRSIPQLREEIRKSMIDEEIAKASELARQRIAAKSVKLDWAKLRELSRSNKAQEGLARTELGLKAKELKIAKKELRANVVNAKNDAQRKAAEAQKSKVESGFKAASEYIDNHNGLKKVNPSGMFKMLKTVTGNKNAALKIMSSYGGRPGKWARDRQAGLSPSAIKWKGILENWGLIQ